MVEDKNSTRRKGHHVSSYVESDVQNICRETGLSSEEIWLLIDNFGSNREKVMRIARAISKSRRA